MYEVQNNDSIVYHIINFPLSVFRLARCILYVIISIIINAYSFLLVTFHVSHHVSSVLYRYERNGFHYVL